MQKLRREPRFLALLGPSGSGKSSVIQAGLIPRCRQGIIPGSDLWGILTARPTEQPFGQLETQGLKDASQDLIVSARKWLDDHPDYTRLVIFLDQFEEILTLCSEQIRQKFVTQLTNLLDAELPVSVILVIRDDFYSRFVQQAHTLTGWLEIGLFNLPPTLNKDELTDIIQEPARAVGLVLETGLVETIVNDTIEAAQGPVKNFKVARNTILPVLEFTLTQLWQRRQQGWLSHEAYHEMGGLTGGLAQSAEEAFKGLEENLIPLARRTLTELVEVGDKSQGLPDVRRRRFLKDLCRSEAEWEPLKEVIGQLTEARLMVVSYDKRHKQEIVEIIHDALLRNWPPLRRWLDEDREFLLWRKRLGASLAQWENTAHDPGALLRGATLSVAEDWFRQRSNDLIPAEQNYIQDSLASARREKKERDDQRNRELTAMHLLAEEQQRGKRWFQGALGLAVALLVLLLIISLILMRQKAGRDSSMAKLILNVIAVTSKSDTLPRAAMTSLWQLATDDSQKAFAHIIQVIEKTESPGNLKSLAEVINALPGEIDHADSRKASGHIIKILEQTSDPGHLKTLIEAFRSVHQKYGSANFQQAFKTIAQRIIQVIRNTKYPPSHRSLAEALRLVPGDIDPGVHRATYRHIITELKETKNPTKLQPLVEALKQLQIEPQNEDSRQTITLFIQRIKETTDPDSIETLGELLATLPGTPDPKDSQTVFEHIISIFEGITDPYQFQKLANALSSLPGEIDATAAAERIINVLEKTTDPKGFEELARALSYLPGNLDFRGAAGRIINVLEKADDPEQIHILVRALGLLSEDLNAENYRKVYVKIIQALKMTTAPYKIQDIVKDANFIMQGLNSGDIWDMVTLIL